MLTVESYMFLLLPLLFVAFILYAIVKGIVDGVRGRQAQNSRKLSRLLEELVENETSKGMGVVYENQDELLRGFLASSKAVGKDVFHWHYDEPNEQGDYSTSWGVVAIIEQSLNTNLSNQRSNERIRENIDLNLSRKEMKLAKSLLLDQLLKLHQRLEEEKDTQQLIIGAKGGFYTLASSYELSHKLLLKYEIEVTELKITSIVAVINRLEALR